MDLTAIFMLVVSSAVLVHDVSPCFLLPEFCRCRSKNKGTVRLRQRSANLEPMKKKVVSLNHMKLRVDIKAAKHTASDNH